MKKNARHVDKKGWRSAGEHACLVHGWTHARPVWILRRGMKCMTSLGMAKTTHGR